MLVPLAEAKLAVPSVHHGVVDRPRVHRALDAGLDGSVTLVAAPAGYGKTTAVRAWCAARGGALAWVTLDAGDDDPGRLWRYVATAVDRVRPGLGVGALRRLGVVGSPIEAAVDELMNGISGLGSELVVVLEDLHEVTSEECLASIDYALGHLAPNARVVLSARVDPALRLSRLRAAGALVEVRAGRSRLHGPGGARAARRARSAHTQRRWRSTCLSSGPRAGRLRLSSRGCGCGPSRTRGRRCDHSVATIALWPNT